HVGVRWYFVGDAGPSIPPSPTLTIPPVSLTDAPVFRKRELWPVTSNPTNGNGTDMRALHTALRSYDSWPVKLDVHMPRWNNVEDYKKNRPEVFELAEHGQRNWEMLCYSNPKSLEAYLESIDRKLRHEELDAGKGGAMIG